MGTDICRVRQLAIYAPACHMTSTRNAAIPLLRDQHENEASPQEEFTYARSVRIRIKLLFQNKYCKHFARPTDSPRSKHSTLTII